MVLLVSTVLLVMTQGLTISSRIIGGSINDDPQEVFQAYDKDSSNGWNKEEFVNYNVETFFFIHDKNEDQKVSMDEWVEAGAQAIQCRGGPDMTADPNFIKHNEEAFKKTDRDEDGFLDSDEVKDSFERRWERIGTGNESREITFDKSELQGIIQGNIYALSCVSGKN